MPKPQTEQLLRFGPYRLGLHSGQLWRGTLEVKLTPKALAVLRCLLEQAGQVVTKEEVFRAVWPDTVVSDAALTACIQELRQALRDDAREPRYIETVHRRGFRFIEKVASSQQEVNQKANDDSSLESRVQRRASEDQIVPSSPDQILDPRHQTLDAYPMPLPEAEEEQGRNSAPSDHNPLPIPPVSTRSWLSKRLWIGVLVLVGVSATVFYLTSLPIPQSAIHNKELLLLPDKPSLAVMPFTNMSGDPEQEYFSDGLTDDLITDLSRLSELFVIARHSVFTYKGKAVKVQDVSKELGVRYVLEGSVRKTDERIRINAQLVDATTGGHLWSERYDQPLTDLFALQDEIIQKIVLALKVELLPEEQERLRHFPTNDVEAHDYHWRGGEYYWRVTKEDNLRARQMFEKAIELDPTYASAYASLSATYWVEWNMQWSQDPQALERAFALAQHARDLDGSLHYAHQMLGLLYSQKWQSDLALAEAQQAVTLAPNQALNYTAQGIVLTRAGKLEDAITSIEKGIRLDPHFAALMSGQLGTAYYWVRRYEEALAALKRHLARYPANTVIRLYLVATYGETGQEEAAKAEVAELLHLNPQFSLEVWGQRANFKDRAAQERLVNVLRKAGLK